MSGWSSWQAGSSSGGGNDWNQAGSGWGGGYQQQQWRPPFGGGKGRGKGLAEEAAERAVERLMEEQKKKETEEKKKKEKKAKQDLKKKHASRSRTTKKKRTSHGSRREASTSSCDSSSASSCASSASSSATSSQMRGRRKEKDSARSKQGRRDSKRRSTGSAASGKRSSRDQELTPQAAKLPLAAPPDSEKKRLREEVERSRTMLAVWESLASTSAGMAAEAAAQSGSRGGTPPWPAVPPLPGGPPALRPAATAVPVVHAFPPGMGSLLEDFASANGMVATAECVLPTAGEPAASPPCAAGGMGVLGPVPPGSRLEGYGIPLTAECIAYICKKVPALRFEAGTGTTWAHVGLELEKLPLGTLGITYEKLIGKQRKPPTASERALMIANTLKAKIQRDLPGYVVESGTRA